MQPQFFSHTDWSMLFFRQWQRFTSYEIECFYEDHNISCHEGIRFVSAALLCTSPTSKKSL